MLQLAEKYGRPPEEVEHWDQYWFERAATALEGESISTQRRVADMRRQQNRK